MLKKHNRYTEEDLREFLSLNYPDIPEESQLVLIHGATTAAQTAAQFYLLSQAAETGKDAVNRATADGARLSLSFWNLGLMSRDRNDPHPMIMQSSASQAATSANDPSQLMTTADGVSLLEIQTNRQEDSRNVEVIEVRSQGDAAEDDRGLPVPNIELLDDPPPEPHVASAAKRGRETSPEHHHGTYRPSLKSLHLMSIDQCIQYENRQPQEREPTGERQRLRGQDAVGSHAHEQPTTAQLSRAMTSRPPDLANCATSSGDQVYSDLRGSLIRHSVNTGKRAYRMCLPRNVNPSFVNTSTGCSVVHQDCAPSPGPSCGHCHE